MTSQLNKIKTALTGISGLKVFHYFHGRQTAPYCIWAEDGEYSSLQADNEKKRQCIEGTVDYFTKIENDQNVESIQTALNGVDLCSWRLSDVIYEDETGLIHYEWIWRVL